MITLTFTADSIGDLLVQLHSIVHASVQQQATAPAVNVAPKPAADLDAPEATSKAAPAPKQPTASEIKAAAKAKAKEAAAKAEPEAEPKEPETKSDLTLLDIRRLLTDYMDQYSEEDTKRILKEHGHAPNLSALKPQYFQAVYDAATAEMTK